LQEAPTAVRLEKRGDYLQVMAANEDGAFLSTGCMIKIVFKGIFHAGLAVCAHDNQAFENARFSSVTVGLPPPQRSVRISALEIVPLDSLDRRVIWYSSAPMEVPSFTAKGDAICFREDGQLKRLSLIGRAEPKLVDMSNISECEMAQPLISSGQRVVHKVDGGRAQIWLEPDDGKPRRLTQEGSNWLPRLAPDAQSFVFISGPARASQGKPATGDYLLMQRPLGDGEARVLAQFYGGPGSLGISPWSPDGRRLVFVSREPALPAD
jgi:Tol biopolymer transport system component